MCVFGFISSLGETPTTGERGKFFCLLVRELRLGCHELHCTYSSVRDTPSISIPAPPTLQPYPPRSLPHWLHAHPIHIPSTLHPHSGTLYTHPHSIHTPSTLHPHSIHTPSTLHPHSRSLYTHPYSIHTPHSIHSPSLGLFRCCTNFFHFVWERERERERDGRFRSRKARSARQLDVFQWLQTCRQFSPRSSQCSAWVVSKKKPWS
jgi:hypothetical protein